MVKTGTANVSWCPGFLYIIYICICISHNASSDEKYMAVTINIV